MPGHDYSLNPQRQSNPFIPTTKPVWLKKHVDSGWREPLRMSAASEFNNGAKDGFSQGLSHMDNLPHFRRDTVLSTTGDDTRRKSISPVVPISDTKLPHQSAPDRLRSRAPSIPRKPAPLSSKSDPPSGPGTAAGKRFRRREPVRSPTSPASAQIMSPDDVASSGQSIDVKKLRQSYVDDAPGLPPRTRGSNGATKNLMDENDSHGCEIESWKPLQPS